MADRVLKALGRRFGDLKVRPKLMVLHNLFFLVLALSVYLAIIPPLERQMARSEAREATAAGAATTAEVAARHEFYEQAVRRARWTLAIALALVYGLAVVLLEAVIMPLYLYRPMRLLLEADRATRRGDTDRELIDPALISGDEIGEIMRSRNETVAQLRKNQADLTAKNELLERQDRLVSLGMLSASIAHELNTPLAVLHGSIEKLRETVEDDAAQQRLARMHRVTDRLRKISESLLDFARVRRKEMAPVAMRRVIDEAWELVRIDEKSATVRFSNAVSRDDIVTGDTDRLVQVFVNLLRNALNAVQSTGTISVQSRRYDAEGRPWIAVSVEDDGPGIPEDVLPQIFEAFVSSRLDARGTGLGLTVAEGIVHQHGGTIEAANRTGGGARLAIRLPAAAVRTGGTRA